MRAAGEGNSTAALLNYEVGHQICKYNEIGSIKIIYKYIYIILGYISVFVSA